MWLDTLGCYTWVCHQGGILCRYTVPLHSCRYTRVGAVGAGVAFFRCFRQLCDGYTMPLHCAATLGMHLWSVTCGVATLCWCTVSAALHSVGILILWCYTRPAHYSATLCPTRPPATLGKRSPILALLAQLGPMHLISTLGACVVLVASYSYGMRPDDIWPCAQILAWYVPRLRFVGSVPAECGATD